MSELIECRKRPLRGALADFKLTLICNTQQVDAGLLSAAWAPDTRCGELRGGLSSPEPGVRPAIQRNYGVTFLRQLRSYVPADCKSHRNIKDSHAETPKATIPEHRSPPRRSRPAGSIGRCGGSYCRRLSSPAAGSGQRIANMAWRSNGNLGRSVAFTEMSDYEPLTKMQCPLVPAILST